MEAVKLINMSSLQDTFLSLATAFLLGAVIGLEREYRQRTAGLRTNVLVSVAAAIFVDIANRLTGHEGAVHVIAYVISGVGFLGAGVIMKTDGNVRGLNTAATLWGAAAVGACAGADLIPEAALATFFVVAGNTLLRPLVNAINRLPIDDEKSEVTYIVSVICDKDGQKGVRDDLEDKLESAGYPVADLSIQPFTANEIQIRATLLSTSVESDILDGIVGMLSSRPSVNQAFWNLSTSG
ncbi:MAG: putative Mg2+ transporter-C (MgtC) family protein [Pseudomonadota bacterium]